MGIIRGFTFGVTRFHIRQHPTPARLVTFALLRCRVLQRPMPSSRSARACPRRRPRCACVCAMRCHSPVPCRERQVVDGRPRRRSAGSSGKRASPQCPGRRSGARPVRASCEARYGRSHCPRPIPPRFSRPGTPALRTRGTSSCRPASPATAGGCARTLDSAKDAALGKAPAGGGACTRPWRWPPSRLPARGSPRQATPLKQ